MGRMIERYFIPLILGFAPILLMLLTWAPSGEPSGTMMVIRSQQLPILAAELIVIVIALREGLPARLNAMRLPRPALAAALALGRSR